MIYETLVRPALFAWSSGDAEKAHELALSALQWLGRHEDLARGLRSHLFVQDARLEQWLWGMHFVNPVGIAAGFDKNGIAVDGLNALGFGFLELGTVTWHPQAGSPRPRMFRLPADGALINRLGFNNEGAGAIAQRRSLATHIYSPIFISIGKSRIVEIDDAIEDYVRSFRAVYPRANGVTVNISSPNTPGLRLLRDPVYLRPLLKALNEARADFVRQGWSRKPIIPKLDPDMSVSELDDTLDVCEEVGVDGLIATNTTIRRDNLRTLINESGGLSGAPLHARALLMVQHVRRRLPSMPIIGVGGIFSAEDACNMLRAGANLVQLYTGFVYKGPWIVRRINRGLLRRMRDADLSSMSDLSSF